MKKSISGFTIVELLIVIVVIAILATISVVAFNGIQERAENTKTVNGVGAYMRIFTLYASDKGEYPSITGYPCLGEPTAVCGRVVNDPPACGTLSIGSAGGISNNTAFGNQLKEYITQPPTVSTRQVVCNGARYVGAYVNPNSTNTKTLSTIAFLRGDAECPLGIGVATRTARQQIDQMTLCQYSMLNL